MCAIAGTSGFLRTRDKINDKVMITIVQATWRSCGGRAAVRFDWDRYCEREEEYTLAYADLLRFLDGGDAVIRVVVDSRLRRKSRFVRAFIEPNLDEEGFLKPRPKSLVLWNLPDGYVCGIDYCVVTEESDKG